MLFGYLFSPILATQPPFSTPPATPAPPPRRALSPPPPLYTAPAPSLSLYRPGGQMGGTGQSERATFPGSELEWAHTLGEGGGIHH
jgi:hypothetical protein